MPQARTSRIMPLRAAMRPRLRGLAWFAADYGINFALLLACAGFGAAFYEVPIKIGAVSLLACSVFFLLIASGASSRLSDPSLMSAQLWAACAIQLFGILLAPKLAFLFMMNLIAPVAYAGLHFRRSTLFICWVTLSVALLVLGLENAARSSALFGMQSGMLFYLAAALTIGRLLAVGATTSDLRVRLLLKERELEVAHAKLGELSSRDELTALWNRREFMRLLQEESRRALRSKAGFCVALINIDHFKQINDRHGHSVGDAVLHEIAQLLEGMRRATDSVARFGGEEFALLLVNARLSTATVALERIRAQVEAFDWQGIAGGLRPTISAGVAPWQPGDTLNQVLNRAERMLRDAKDAGRNCVRAATDIAAIDATTAAQPAAPAAASAEPSANS